MNMISNIISNIINPCEIKKRPKNLFLMTTSLVFIFNIIECLLLREYMYAVLFILLNMSSLLFHYSGCKLTMMIDKLVILSVTCYGFYVMATTEKSFFSKITVMLSLQCMLSIYFLGYIFNQWCFSKCPITSSLFHSLIHFITSIGHHIFLNY